MAKSRSKFPTPAIPLSEHPATLPRCSVDAAADHAIIATSAIRSLNNLNSGSLAENAIWRDTFALTSTLRTFYGPALVSTVWRELGSKHTPIDFAIRPHTSRVVRLGPKTSWIEAIFDFRVEGNRPSTCSGTIGLIPGEGSEWKIWLLCTILERIDGWPDVDDLRAKQENTLHDPSSGEKHKEKVLPEHIDCLVVGGSIGGLCMAGRLQALGVPYLVVDQHAKVGHIWTEERYASLRLHTARDYNQLLGHPRTFSPKDPYHLTAHDLVAGLQRYIDNFAIQIALSTTLLSAQWEPIKKIWHTVLRHGDQDITMTTHHIVLAVGNDGAHLNMPQLPNKHIFQGDVLHGGQWRNASQWQGKRGVVVGSANTAHGVISDMARASMTPITMIQRSKTFVLPVSTFSALVDPVYNQQTPTEKADRKFMGYPLAIKRLMGLAGVRAAADRKSEYFDGLEATGFDGERYGDLWSHLYEREGGHFFDLGAGKLIIDGIVTVRSKVSPVEYTRTGIKLSDGTSVDADVIVFATGYKGNIKATAKQVFGNELADSLEEYWQCDEEGELRGAWKASGHPGIWYIGHGFAHVRYFTRFVAMHIKADLDGRPLETYTDTPCI